MTPEEQEKYYKEHKQEFEEQLSVAKIDVLQSKNIKWLAPKIFKKEPEFDSTMPTAAADGQSVKVGIEFWKNLPRKKRFRAIVHEAFHNFMGHCDKVPNTRREHLKRNIAMDCVTEATLTECGVGEGNYIEGCINPTADGTVNLKWNDKKIIISRCQDKAWEEVYSILDDHDKKNPTPPGKEPIIEGWGPFDHHEFKDFTEEEKAEVKNGMRKALNDHKLRGTMPGGLADLIKEMLKGKVNWRQELRAMVQPEIKSYQTYRKINRKYNDNTFVRPNYVKEGVKVTLAGDTSGSIGEDEMKYFLGETHNLFNQFGKGMVKANMMLHHTQVYADFPLKEAKDMTKIRTQSGGTSHLDVFKKAEEQKAKILICFTDGYSEFVESTTIKKVIWICTSEDGMNQIPDNLGKKILVDIKDFRGN